MEKRATHTHSHTHAAGRAKKYNKNDSGDYFLFLFCISIFFWLFSLLVHKNCALKKAEAPTVGGAEAWRGGGVAFQNVEKGSRKK